MIIKRLIPYTELAASRFDPVNFPPRADYLSNYISKLPSDIGKMADEFNATANDVNSKASQANQSASSAQLAATAAQSSANYAGLFTPGVTSAIAGNTYFYDGRIWTCTVNTSQTPSYPSINWFAGLGRFDIVGTVSQFNGVPAGAIIQKGSNANGSFTIFADGTCFVRHVSTYTPPDENEWTYPVQFSAIPFANVSSRHGASNLVVTGQNTPGLSSLIFRAEVLTFIESPLEAVGVLLYANGDVAI